MESQTQSPGTLSSRDRAVAKDTPCVRPMEPKKRQLYAGGGGRLLADCTALGCQLSGTSLDKNISCQGIGMGI